MSNTDDDAPEGNKRNIILGYKVVEDIKLGIAGLKGDVEGLSEKMVDLKNNKVDHEVRIRALELTQAVVAAAGTSSKSVWLWVWGAAIALPGSITAIVSLIRLVGGYK